MVEMGIIDSVQVARSSLIDGLSVGSMILTLESVVIKDEYYDGIFYFKGILLSIFWMWGF